MLCIYPANEIPEDAFYSYVYDGKVSLTAITLPATLESIGREAFLNTGLTAVTLPETVTSIGDWAFQGTLGFSGNSFANNHAACVSHQFRCQLFIQYNDATKC